MSHGHNHSHANLGNASYPREVRRILVIALVLNWLVAFLKLVFGYAMRSASMVADGYHSLADGASNIIGLFGIGLAAQPKDHDHPYGHKKYETFASVFIAFLLFGVCFHVLHESWERLRLKETPHISGLSFLVMGVTILVNIAVAVYEYRRGKSLGSDILVADSHHTRSDILTSLAVLAAFAGVRLGYPMLDSVAALVICVFIAFSALEILRSSSSVLCDTAAIDAREIERMVLGIAGVRRCHRIRTRGRADDVHIDLHVLLDDKMPLAAAHEVSSKIESVLKAHFSGVTDVVAHLEPLSSEGDHHHHE